MFREFFLVMMIVADLAASSRADNADVSAQLASAQRDYAVSMRKTEIDLMRAQIAVKQKYIAAIEIALKNATKAGDLDTANAINDEKRAINSEIADLKDAIANGTSPEDSSFKQPTTVAIDAKQGWQTILHVNKGQIIHLKADGTWRTYDPVDFVCNAEGIHNGKETYPFTTVALPGALIGKIGDSIFLIGKAARIEVPEDGDLQVRINKKDGYLHDDSGQLMLTIRNGESASHDKSEHRAP